jgi:hypothetical protein
MAAMLVDITKETNKLEQSPTRHILFKSTKMAAITSHVNEEYSILGCIDLLGTILNLSTGIYKAFNGIYLQVILVQ